MELAVFFTFHGVAVVSSLARIVKEFLFLSKDLSFNDFPSPFFMSCCKMSRGRERERERASLFCILLLFF